MKLSFTTLGCPDWPLDKIITRAAEYGFDAIDFRGLAGELNIYKLAEFTDQANETVARIADAGLRVSCFSSSVQVFSTEYFARNVEEIKQYARLCELFGTSYIRVFGGKIGDTERSEAIRTASGHLRELANVAAASGVKVLMETHDDWIDCHHMQQLMEQADAPAAGVLWDLHHPYRVIGEQPEETLRSLGQWIEYTHVKDSRPVEGEKNPFQYCLTGEGDIPLKHMISLLKQNGYEGYYTFEWEKKWHPNLQEADIAFPHYVQYMRNVESSLG